jgi:putative photosynthetic complex assembly protein
VARDDAFYGPPSPQLGSSVAATDLLFVDGPEGQIVVLHATTGAELARYDSGEGSFLRGILRSLVRERRVRHLESGGVFHLALLDNGSLVISDPDTGYWMALEAFGVDNRRAFAELLDRASHLAGLAASDTGMGT